MLTGWTFFRMPSRVPLSTLSPAQDAFERKEERSRPPQALRQPPPVLLDERLEHVRRQMTCVLRQQRPLHPVEHAVRSGQNMRIDDQADFGIAETKRVQQTRVGIGREDVSRQPPSAERRAV